MPLSLKAEDDRAIRERGMDEDGIELGMSKMKRKHLAMHINPPGQLSWCQMSLVMSRSQKREDVTNEHDEGDDILSDVSSTISDDEDKRLEEAMMEMDKDDDIGYEDELWQSLLPSNRLDEVGDEGSPLPGKSSRESASSTRPNEEGDGIRESPRTIFLEVQKEIGKARRRRHQLRNRSRRPLKQIKQSKFKSKDYISSSETERGGEEVMDVEDSGVDEHMREVGSGVW